MIIYETYLHKKVQIRLAKNSTHIQKHVML